MENYMTSFNNLEINYTSGDLNITFKELESLEGFPEHITGGFGCCYNAITSLTGGPQQVDGDYNCSYNQLTDLDGCPQHITGDFNCIVNPLKTLIGGPQRVDGQYICRNTKITSLTGCASHIGVGLYCHTTPLKTLVGIHNIIKSCPEICFDSRKIKQGGIGLLLIENLTTLSYPHSRESSANSLSLSIPFQIIASYLGKGTDGMIACRAELIANGYEAYAKL